MTEQFALREFSPKAYDNDREILTRFLLEHNLKYEDDIEFAVGLYQDENLLACGCCSGALLKCFAVKEQLRGQNVLGRIVSALVANRFTAGYFEPFVITPPYNRTLFVNCGFYPVAETSELILFERRSDGIERFAAALQRPGDSGKPAGAIVVNCNPFTRGHRYLIEYAAARCELLYIFVVQEDRSVFPFEIRLRLVEQGVADLPNVRVCAGGNYIISSATFPTYFLKQEDDAVEMQANLDATLFATRIAPLFSIKKRFVGSEPKCPVTSQYNRVLHRVLPAAGIMLEELPRCNSPDGEVISASRLRRMLAEGILDSSLLRLAPESTYQYLISAEAAPVISTLRNKK